MARVLFVDDDPLTLETLTKAVQVFGHQAILASTGQEALATATEQSPELIFVDMSLPDMDGFALVDSLCRHEATNHIPVYMLSAGPETEMSERAVAAGARAFLSKPIRLQTLLDVIKENTQK
jgi:CheY-like chemotaxis protein